MGVSPRRIEVEIDALVLDDPVRAPRDEIAAGLERTLATDRALSAALGRDLPAEVARRAIARAVSQELGR
jgi:hypothetical protein